MNSLKSMVASILRLVAVGLMLVGIALLAVGWVAQRRDEGGMGSFIVGVIGFVLGVLLAIFSSSIAGRLTRDYE